MRRYYTSGIKKTIHCKGPDIVQEWLLLWRSWRLHGMGPIVVESISSQLSTDKQSGRMVQATFSQTHERTHARNRIDDGQVIVASAFR